MMEFISRLITVREVVQQYHDAQEKGVTAWNGKLNIRPPYQREFVYKEAQEQAVIETVRLNAPLNYMCWVDNGNEEYEVLDGQQRLLSICRYVTSAFSLNFQKFHNLQLDEQEQILDYNLEVKICRGTPSEKLGWFRRINIAGTTLVEQELRNAVYSGPWLSDAKLYFSKPNCEAIRKGGKYLNGSPIRQDYLESVIKWISKGQIEHYMSEHQLDDNADELQSYFEGVIDWIESTFPEYRKEMKGLNWGDLYTRHREKELDPVALETRIQLLLMDEEVQNKKGIWPYVLDNDPSHLQIRFFGEKEKAEAYERQKGICVNCNVKFEREKMQADHITPWSKGGKTVPENCQMLCAECNRRKSNV